MSLLSTRMFQVDLTPTTEPYLDGHTEIHPNAMVCLVLLVANIISLSDEILRNGSPILLLFLNYEYVNC
jgi:hypothetical protein